MPFPLPPRDRAYKLNIGTVDGYIRSLWLYARELGAYPELEWTFPRSIHRAMMLAGVLPAFFYESASDFNTVKDALLIASALDNKLFAPSVHLGLEFFDSGYRVPDGRLPMPIPYDRFRGRHMIQPVSYSSNELVFPNTWGERWGDKGFGYLSRQYYNAHVDDASVTWCSLRGPSSSMLNCLESTTMRHQAGWERLSRCWMSRNSWNGEPFRHHSEEHVALTWRVFSSDTGKAVDVLEIRSKGDIVGRIHVYSADRPGGPTSVRELFVAPHLRRRGYGSLMEQWADDIAREAGSATIELWLLEADSQPRSRPFAESFATSRGYLWRRVGLRRPNVVAIAVKEIA